MDLSEYVLMFGFVALLGAGVPGPGDAALLAAGTLAGEGKLSIWIVLVVAAVAFMVGAMLGYRLASAAAARCSTTPGTLRSHARSCWPRATVRSIATTSWPR
jgi:membrane protein DedA with SNARE-associated domain